VNENILFEFVIDQIARLIHFNILFLLRAAERAIRYKSGHTQMQTHFGLSTSIPAAVFLYVLNFISHERLHHKLQRVIPDE
jgi:hypothetical protein